MTSGRVQVFLTAILVKISFLNFPSTTNVSKGQRAGTSPSGIISFCVCSLVYIFMCARIGLETFAFTVPKSGYEVGWGQT